ncbi:MAG TPA: DUF1844 domain-containing protein [Blastocatellia bacterium]|nr:DUF1844 domain-containing protein [Blastocatellia bacterium]
MSDERESTFKVTDRRKFNVDGSPRDQSAAPEIVAVAHDSDESQSTPVETQSATPEPGNAAGSESSNVVSFPGESARSRDYTGPSSSSSAPSASPPPSDARTAGSVSSNAQQGAAEQAFSKVAGPRPAGVPEASLLDLLDMLAVQAALHLGMLPAENQERLPIDLQVARHFIDMLAVLQAKTRGNLNDEEERSLENALAELRMRYVEVSRGQ